MPIELMRSRISIVANRLGKIGEYSQRFAQRFLSAASTARDFPMISTKKLGPRDTAWIDRLRVALGTILQAIPTGPAKGSTVASPSAAQQLAPPPATPVGPAPGTDHGERALICHRTAETHINAALYELDRLRDEVAAVLSTNRDQAATEPGVRGSGPVATAAPRRKPGIAA